jgi:hypothetical protein
VRAAEHGGGANLRRPARPANPASQPLAAPALVAALLLALLALPWPAAAGAGLAPLPPLPPATVTMLNVGDSTLRLDGRFVVAAPLATAWQVLSDYDHIPAFVSSMHESRVISRSDGALVVEQRFSGRLLWFERTCIVRLSIHEEPQQTITFRDVSRASFERYEGEWTLRETAAGVEVTYRLIVKDGLVGLVMKGAAPGMVRNLLDQVRAEIGRRAAEGAR